MEDAVNKKLDEFEARINDVLIKADIDIQDNDKQISKEKDKLQELKEKQDAAFNSGTVSLYLTLKKQTSEQQELINVIESFNSKHKNDSLISEDEYQKWKKEIGSLFADYEADTQNKMHSIMVQWNELKKEHSQTIDRFVTLTYDWQRRCKNDDAMRDIGNGHKILDFQRDDQIKESPLASVLSGTINRYKAWSNDNDFPEEKTEVFNPAMYEEKKEG